MIDKSNKNNIIKNGRVNINIQTDNINQEPFFRYFMLFANF